MTTSEFESSFDRLTNCIDELPEGKSGGPSAFFRQVYLEGAAGDLMDAQVESRAGNVEGAWLHLVKAAEAVGYCGETVMAASFLGLLTRVLLEATHPPFGRATEPQRLSGNCHQ